MKFEVRNQQKLRSATLKYKYFSKNIYVVLSMGCRVYSQKNSNILHPTLVHSTSANFWRNFKNVLQNIAHLYLSPHIIAPYNLQQQCFGEILTMFHEIFHKLCPTSLNLNIPPTHIQTHICSYKKFLTTSNSLATLFDAIIVANTRIYITFHTLM